MTSGRCSLFLNWLLDCFSSSAISLFHSGFGTFLTGGLLDFGTPLFFDGVALAPINAESSTLLAVLGLLIFYGVPPEDGDALTLLAGLYLSWLIST